MHWRAIWAWLRTWQGAIPAAIAVLAALYYGPRKMLETWDWYWDRFRDNAVFFVIQRRKLVPRVSDYITGRSSPPLESSYTVREIADYLGRKESSVHKSIKRLQHHGKIERYGEGWRLKT